MKKKKVKTHTFDGVRYEILIGNFDGAADTHGTYSLLINGDTNTQKGLITLIHEAMHAGNWDKHEETIERSSKEIGRLLWRLGWRQSG